MFNKTVKNFTELNIKTTIVFYIVQSVSVRCSLQLLQLGKIKKNRKYLSEKYLF